MNKTNKLHAIVLGDGEIGIIALPCVDNHMIVNFTRIPKAIIGSPVKDYRISEDGSFTPNSGDENIIIKSKEAYIVLKKQLEAAARSLGWEE